MNRKAAAAAGVGVLGPLLAALAIHQPDGSSGSTGCAVRYTSAPGSLRLTVTLEQPGSIEARVGGQVVTQQDEPAGRSAITTSTATGALAVTEWTGGGQLLACPVTPG